MLITLLSIGKKMPDWVDAGFAEYARRMTGDCRIRLHEIAQVKQGAAAAIREKEGLKLLRAIPGNSTVIALDVQGQCWSTEDTARQLSVWKESGRDVCLLAGGPEGLSPGCLAVSNQRWSLSPLTFPHPLVRVIVAEQLYRAESILRSHPYHRA